MRNIVLALLLALAALGYAGSGYAGQGGLDFGDMPPLPPPLLDDGPAPPPLSPPAATAPTVTSPLAPPGLVPPPVAPATSTAPATPPATASAPSGTSSLTPPPLAPPPLAPPSGPSGLGAIALPDEVGGPATPPTQAVAAAPVDETPRPGRISGGRVNVRAGPNTQYESIDVLTTGAPVTVLARHGDWFKIVFPPDKLASIPKIFVNADITGEIPEEGVPGVVNQDNADVHAYYWDKSTVVGKLNRGDPVMIMQERGQWYRIAAPDSARAYVFAQYVRVDGNEQVAVDAAPAPENPAIDLAQGKPDATGRLKLSEDDRRAAEIKEAYFARLREQQEREEEQAVVQVSRLEEALDDLEARIQEIEQETSSRLGYSYQMPTTSMGYAGSAPADPVYGGFTGWVENIGRVGGAPASFRLTRDGEIRYYLRSDQFDLANFAGQQVWLNGTIELATGANANILNVSQIRLLSNAEIVQGVQQMPSAPVTTPYDPYDPYAPAQSGMVISGPVVSTVGDPFAPGAVIQSGIPYTADGGAATVPVPVQGGAAIPPGVSDVSQLPEVVGAGQSFITPSAPIVSGGVIGSDDYFESPIISEIGP